MEENEWEGKDFMLISFSWKGFTYFFHFFIIRRRKQGIFSNFQDYLTLLVQIWSSIEFYLHFLLDFFQLQCIGGRVSCIAVLPLSFVVVTRLNTSKYHYRLNCIIYTPNVHIRVGTILAHTK